VICFRYRHAIRVFVQRDDGVSNAAWVWKLYHKCHTLRQRRVGTLTSTEQGAQGGLPNNSTEMDALTTPQSLTPEPDETSAEDLQFDHTSTEAASFRSTGIESPSRTNFESSAFPPPRRRLTELQSQTNVPDQGASARLAQNNNRAFHRKPLSPSSQLHGH
jgi:hypothetical protein